MAGIYLDHNATTPLLPEALEAMRPYLLGVGNASSSHHYGRKARQALESAREEIAGLVGARSDEVIFTSGATEANNLALFGLPAPAPGVILRSPFEHPAVVEPIKQHCVQGYSEAILPATRKGSIDLDRVLIPENLRLVSVMLANHETGAIQPIEALAARLEERAPFHCDAAAAVGKIPIAFHRLGVASLAFTAHKFHGPAGVGVLLLRRCTILQPLFFGGHQQQGKRPGTESVALVVGMAKALAWSLSQLETHRTHVRLLRNRFLDLLRAEVSPVILNGQEDGIPNTMNLSFPGCQGDALLMNLDLAEVACSTGSACSSGSLLPSPVLLAMGLEDDLLRSALRLSFSPLQTLSEIEEAAFRVIRVVKKLRR